MLLIWMKQSICILLIKLQRHAGLGFINDIEMVAAVVEVVIVPLVFVASAVIAALRTAVVWVSYNVA